MTPQCDANGEDGRVLLQRLAGRVYQVQRHNLPLLLLSIAVPVSKFLCQLSTARKLLRLLGSTPSDATIPLSARFF